MTLWRSSPHPGWPMPSGRCGCPAAWSDCGRPAARRRGVEPIGWPTARTSSRGSRRRRELGSAACYFGWPRCAGVCVRRPGRAGCCRTDRSRRRFLRPADDRQRDAGGIAVRVDRLLGGHDAHRAGVATGALALGMDHAFGPVGLHRLEATVRPENAASRAVLRRPASARRACCGAISKSTAHGAITCSWPSPSRRSTAR